MQERVRRPIAVFVVSVLLAALAAGAALAVNNSGTLGADRADGVRVTDPEEVLGSFGLKADGMRITDFED
jgi:hypothetical protein